MQRKIDFLTFFLFLFIISLIYLISFTEVPDFRKPIRFLSIVVFIIGLLVFFIFKKNLIQVKTTENSNSCYKEIAFAFLACVIYSIHFFSIHNSHFQSFFLGDMDYVSMAEVLNSTLKGNFFSTNYHGQTENSNYLSHHFSPAIILLSPFMVFSEYRLGYGYSLLFYNLLGVFAISLYLISRNIRGFQFFFLLCFFMINIYVYRLFQSYHFEQIFLFFCVLLFWAIQKEKKILSYFLFLICIFIKEDISIYMTLLGIFLLFTKRKKMGTILIAVSIGYFFYLVPWIQDSIDSGAKINWLLDWSKWGNSISEIAIQILSNPIKVFMLFVQKKSLLFDISLSFSFLFFFYPKIFLILIPIFIFHFSSDRIWFNDFYNYYSYTILPFLIYGSVEGFKKIENFQPSKNLLTLPFLLLFLSLTLFRSSKDQFFPLQIPKIDYSKFQSVIEASSIIPNHSKVNAQFDVSGFVNRKSQIFPMTMEPKDYLFFNLQNGFSPYKSLEELKILKDSLLHSKKFQTIFEKDGIIVIQRVSKHKISKE
ncbi:MAG: DUF2079 domain-containing protein [Leptospiraceae bacterium]|nr:DUF2079 domain-containing protein [Leptospiraceae bacterium]MCK6379667.1 DUF2079 domain-containing protein [Leptospiraceae bacterium]NUM40120.1 DUF2079 domain-containing protein [Leptospiraceae bacterium]